MDSLQYQYIRINKILLCCIGQWPHQSTKVKICILLIFLPFISIQPILQGGGLVTSTSDIDMFMEGFAPFLISCMCFVKYFNFIYNNDKMKILLITIENDWKEFVNSGHEREILQQYYKIGEKLTIAYAASVYGSMVSFMAIPAIIITSSLLGFANITDNRPLMFPVENFVNINKYYYPVLIHSYFGTVGITLVVVAIDTMYIVYIQHACASIEILGHRLGLIVENSSIHIDLKPRKLDDLGLKNARECVLLHNRIIKYADLLQIANTVSFFLQLGLNMICISFTLFQAAMKMDTPNDSLRYAFFTIAQSFHLFCEAWPAQQLIDHSSRVSEYASNCKWYLSSFGTRRLLNIMIIRSLSPLKITAGKVYILNLENFSKVVRTSFSYFTVLCSMR